MRVLVIVALFGSTASADPLADVAKAHVEGIAKLGTDDDALGLAKDATGLDRRGYEFDRSGACGADCKHGGGASLVYEAWTDAAVRFKITKTLTGSSGDVGWFHVTFDSTIKSKDGAMSERANLRFSALATRTGTSWSIAGVGYGEAVPDSALKSRRRAVLGGKKVVAVVGGDKKIATAFADWYAKGLASHAEAAALLVASGSSPGESASGAAALELVRRWDALHLTPSSVTARSVAGGKAVWIQGTVLMPRKGKKLPSVLELTAVLVPAADGAWRWVALHYFSPKPDGMEDVMDDDRLILLTPKSE